MASPAATSKLGAELEWLQTTLRRLRATISDAEQMQTEGESFALWLQEMKDIACDAEDLIGEFEYEELRRRIEGKRGGRGLARSSLEMVYEIKRRLGDIGKYKHGLGIGDVGCRPDQEVTQEMTQQTSFLPTEPEIFGREKEKEEIIRFLLAPDDDSVVSTIAIAGMGGLGKTTLAQLVYNDSRIVEHFKPRMWIWTTPDYDVVNLSREILVSLDMDKGFPWGLENLNVYHSAIVDKLEGKRFLLVLDNLWDRNQQKWQRLVAPLMYGSKKGSKILITTRDTGLASILQFRKTIELEGLPFDDCWMVFKTHAFFGGNSGEYPRLETIGRQIVDKFKGVPLAAAVIGDLLRSTPEESDWRRILESEMREIEQVEDVILSVLKLSYELLTPQLKHCLAYCSLFPKNYRFDGSDLVRQWMAQGFIQNGRWGRTEDVGTRCLNDLFNRSFFQLVDGKYVVHDLIHDLALLVSHRDYLITYIGGLHSSLGDNHSFRHLSLLMTSRRPDLRDLQRFLAHRGLRTLAFYFPSYSECRIPLSLFLSLNTLRVLDLSCGGIKMLPDSIGNLRHLRYLNLRGNDIKSLPESLCCLYKLQTLKLKGCNHIAELPQGIGKLINLRHLEVGPFSLSGVVGMGNLTCLQELESFPISEQAHGLKIDDLKDMNELRGRLCIRNLHWVSSKEEAMGAVLDRKRHLVELEMKWGRRTCAGHGNSKLDEEILEALVPPAGLKAFAIDGYGGENAPTWLEQQFRASLESISLTNCRNWSSLPVPSGMSSLTRIRISGCPQLRNLPSLPTTLKELVIYDLMLKELPDFYQRPQPDSGSGNSIIPSLSILKINSCSALKSLRGGLLRHHLGNLTVLRIEHCYQLVDWPEGTGFQATLLSLQEELRIECCPKLEAFPATLSPSLKRLQVTDSPNAVNEALLAQLHSLSSESSFYVNKDYTNLASCYEQVFKHIAVDWLAIGDIGRDKFLPMRSPEDHGCLRLVCGKQSVWSWRCDEWVPAVQVQIWPRRPRRLDLRGGARLPGNMIPPEEWWKRRSPPERHQWPVDRWGPICDFANTKPREWNGLVSSCFGEHHLPWASSVRWLVVDGTFHGAFLPFETASLEGLWISRFRGPTPLLPDALLSHLAGLMELQIFDCPELTLSSLKEVVSSLPSLQHLTIEQCPKLSSSSLPCTHYAATSPSDAAKLRTFFIDDAKLLGDVQFVQDCLSSLHGLHIWEDRNLTSFTTAMEEGLRTLGQSLQHLSFNDCDELEHLPSDMRSLLPSLKALSIRKCSKLCHLPMGGLPSSLDILVLHECDKKLEMPPPPPGTLMAQQTDWRKTAHIPVIVNNGWLFRGSYREFLELRMKWRDF